MTQPAGPDPGVNKDLSQDKQNNDNEYRFCVKLEAKKPSNPKHTLQEIPESESNDTQTLIGQHSHQHTHFQGHQNETAIRSKQSKTHLNFKHPLLKQNRKIMQKSLADKGPNWYMNQRSDQDSSHRHARKMSRNTSEQGGDIQTPLDPILIVETPKLKSYIS